MILTPGPVSISPLQFLFASFYRSLALAPHLSLLTSPHRCHGAVPQSCAASSSIPSLSTLLLLQPHVFTQGSRAVISLRRLKYCMNRRPLPFIFFFLFKFYFLKSTYLLLTAFFQTATSFPDLGLSATFPTCGPSHHKLTVCQPMLCNTLQVPTRLLPKLCLTPWWDFCC